MKLSISLDEKNTLSKPMITFLATALTCYDYQAAKVLVKDKQRIEIDGDERVHARSTFTHEDVAKGRATGMLEDLLQQMVDQAEHESVGSHPDYNAREEREQLDREIKDRAHWLAQHSVEQFAQLARNIRGFEQLVDWLQPLPEVSPMH